MESIATITWTCLWNFNNLMALLEKCSSAHPDSMSPKAIDNEIGRFKIWIGNLGALQKGHSSLDFRLRESTVMCSNILKLLDQLSNALSKCIEVVSGQRLPWEQQTEAAHNNGDEDITDSSEEEFEPPSSPADNSELGLHLCTILDVISDLYRLSFMIRTHSHRTVSTRATSYKELDETTGEDIFSIYAIYDRNFVEDVLKKIRQNRHEPNYEFLTDRLSLAITNRRRCLKYWFRHSQKLAAHVAIPEHGAERKSAERNDLPTVAHNPTQIPAPIAASRNFLSTTEATKYDQRFDDPLETNSTISNATTAYNLDGASVKLPPPPSLAPTDSEFVCPFCHVLCPAKIVATKSWRTHVLHDLQPYVCTYSDCPKPEQMYASRHAWLEHERLAHCRVWQCFEHTGMYFDSEQKLLGHLSGHHGHLTGLQMSILAGLSDVTLEDKRKKCPFCFFEGDFPRGFSNHMANHQEELSLFSVPSSSWGNDTTMPSPGNGPFAVPPTISSLSSFDSRPVSQGANIEPEILAPLLFHCSVAECQHHIDGFATQHALDEHMERDHVARITDPDSLRCPGQRHLRLDGNFRCPSCLGWFSRKSDLRRHLLTLNPPLFYCCPLCDTQFSRVDRFRDHMRSHHPESREWYEFQRGTNREALERYAVKNLNFRFPDPCACGNHHKDFDKWFHHAVDPSYPGYCHAAFPDAQAQVTHKANDTEAQKGNLDKMTSETQVAGVGGAFLAPPTDATKQGKTPDSKETNERTERERVKAEIEGIICHLENGEETKEERTEKLAVMKLLLKEVWESYQNYENKMIDLMLTNARTLRPIPTPTQSFTQRSSPGLSYAAAVGSTQPTIMNQPARISREIRVKCPEIPERMKGKPTKEIQEEINKELGQDGRKSILGARRLESGDIVLVAASSVEKAQREKKQDWMKILGRGATVKGRESTVLVHGVTKALFQNEKQE
ncbi:Checkpoint kinase 2, partial [Myotisia sp. PD_48]